MASTMLQLITSVYNETGQSVAPTAVAGNSNTDVLQTLALMNAVGNYLVRRHEWQALTASHRFYTTYYSYTGNSTLNSLNLTGMSLIVGLDSNFQVSGTGINQDTNVVSASGTTVVLDQQAQATATGTTFTFGQTKYPMPSDFDRQINRTHYDKSKHWPILGPETAQEWEWLKSSYISTGPMTRYRILGGKFQIWPIPTTNAYLGFEYISNYWVSVTGASATSKSAFTVDTDTCVFPDRLMITGTKLRYFSVKGFDTTAYQKEFDDELARSIGYDGGKRTLSYSPRMSSVLVTQNNIPDSGYGGG